MKALVLEKQLELNLRDIDLPTDVGPDDVKSRCILLEFVVPIFIIMSMVK